jgi:hypothetical protein
MKGKKKSKSKGKESANVQKFVPMSSHWPGKISNPDLFSTFAQEIRAKIEAKKENPLISLKIIHLGLRGFRDFMITIPKETSISRLQCEITRIQFDGSVPPSDIIIFLQRVESPFDAIEKRYFPKKLM